MRFHAASQCFITRNPSQLDQRLSFKWCGLAIRAVVILEFFKWSRPRARIAIGPKPQIDVKDAFRPSIDEVNRLSRERFEVGRILATLVDAHQLQIGCITHLASAELAESAYS